MTAVIMAVIAGIVAAYAKSWLDSQFAGAIRWWRDRSASRSAEWTARIARISTSDRERTDEIALEARQHLNALQCVGESIVFILFAVLIKPNGGLIGSLLLFLALLQFFRSVRYDLIAFTTELALREARRERNRRSANQ